MHYMHPCLEQEKIMEENIKKMELEAELRELRSELQANTSDVGDWKIVKALEYQLSGEEIPYDIKELNAKRQAIRDRINAIEVELAEIE